MPAVVPFVFYHGEDNWKIPNEFLYLVDTEAGWEDYLLNFRFPVLDLGAVPDTKLSENKRLRPWLVAMKYATRKDQQMAVVELLVASLKGAPEDLFPIVYYLVRVYGYDKPTLRKIIRDVRPKEEGKMMSQFTEDIRSQFAQEIERKVRDSVLQEGIRKGLQAGLQEGLQEGRYKKAVEIVRALLGEGVAINIISKSSGLSEEEIRGLSIH